MVVYLRHGPTQLNGHGSEERLRGWLSAPLTPKGRKQVEDAASSLRGIPFKSFSSSDLMRAKESADIVSQHIGIPNTPTPNLRDWNTGHLAGQKFDDVKDELFHYIDHPDVAVPQGEPLNTYIERFINHLKPLVESLDTHLVVGHARGSQVLSGLAAANGQWIHPGPLKDKPVIDPAQTMIISPDWSVTPEK